MNKTKIYKDYCMKRYGKINFKYTAYVCYAIL